MEKELPNSFTDMNYICLLQKLKHFFLKNITYNLMYIKFKIDMLL